MPPTYRTVRADDLLFLSNGTKLTELKQSILLLLNTKCNQALKSRCSLYLVLTNILLFFSMILSNIILSLTFTSTIVDCIIELTDCIIELTDALVMKLRNLYRVIYRVCI